jgi:hypothetical protein
MVLTFDGLSGVFVCVRVSILVCWCAVVDSNVLEVDDVVVAVAEVRDEQRRS